MESLCWMDSTGTWLHRSVILVTQPNKFLFLSRSASVIRRVVFLKSQESCYLAMPGSVSYPSRSCLFTLRRRGGVQMFDIAPPDKKVTSPTRSPRCFSFWRVFCSTKVANSLRNSSSVPIVRQYPECYQRFAISIDILKISYLCVTIKHTSYFCIFNESLTK